MVLVLGTTYLKIDDLTLYDGIYRAKTLKNIDFVEKRVCVTLEQRTIFEMTVKKCKVYSLY